MNRLAAEDEPPGDTNAVTLFLAILNLFGGVCGTIVMFICLLEKLRNINVCVCYGQQMYEFLNEFGVLGFLLGLRMNNY